MDRVHRSNKKQTEFPNKNIKMSSFIKSSENIQKKECGPDRSVSINPLQ